MHQGPYTLIEVGFLQECKNQYNKDSNNIGIEDFAEIKDMATVLGYKKDAIRIKVMKYEGAQQPECKRFSVDPQITSYEVLNSLLIKAFDIKKVNEFSICYRVMDDYGQEAFLPLLSDYELEAAIVNASEPCLYLRIDFVENMMSPVDEDVAECVQPESTISLFQNKVPFKIQGLIKNQVEKTFNIFKGALSYMEEQSSNVVTLHHPPREPLSDVEFRNFLGPVGQIIQSRELRTVIYFGGIEPSLRKVVWKHILNVYPEGMSGKERLDYTKRKSEEYIQLRDSWKDLLKRGQMFGDLAYVTGMVRKDVLRTDRHHPFYEGADDNCNTVSLFNILTTYALNHPVVSYCQGMSDLASPLLVTMGNEATAYICFCALMRRLSPNFLLDGITMTQRFQHLADGLEFYHPKFHLYLKSHQADDLLFCYRWLLLEMKREFAFNDALVMLEVMWSSLPPNPPHKELPLYDKKFEPPLSELNPPQSPSPSPRENQYTKVCAIRRQTTSSATSSPFKLNNSLEESELASRRKLNPKNSIKIETYSNLNDTKILSTNGILKSSLHNVYNTNHAQSSNDNSSQASHNSQVSQQNLVQKFTQLTKNNIHKSLEKINLQQNMQDITSNYNNLLNRRGSLKLSNTFANNLSPNTIKSHTASATKIVKNLNEFLSFSSNLNNKTVQKNVACDINHDRLSKQISLDERNMRKTDLILEKDQQCRTINTKQSNNCNEDNENIDETNNCRQSNENNLKETQNLSDPDCVRRFSEGNINNSYNNVGATKQSYYPKLVVSSIVENDIETISETNINMKGGNGDKEMCNNGDVSLVNRINEIEKVLQKKIEDIPQVINDEMNQSEDTDDEDDDSGEYYPMTSSITQEVKMELESLNRNVLFDSNSKNDDTMLAEGIESGFESNTSSTNNTNTNSNTSIQANEIAKQTINRVVPDDNIFVWENPLGPNDNNEELLKVEIQDLRDNELFSPILKSLDTCIHIKQSSSTQSFDSNKSSFDSESTNSSTTTSGADTSIHSTDSGKQMKEISDSNDEIKELAHLINKRQTRCKGLPPPNEFGGGNPFLMFLCITVLGQHSEYIMKNSMDYNETAIYFDKMIRKHNVHKVLNEARKRYEKYLCDYRQLQRSQQPPRA